MGVVLECPAGRLRGAAALGTDRGVHQVRALDALDEGAGQNADAEEEQDGVGDEVQRVAAHDLRDPAGRCRGAAVKWMGWGAVCVQLITKVVKIGP